MARLGAIGDAALTRRAAAAVGRELRELGFNLDFAPVLDVATNPDNPVIGDRAFSSDPTRVAEQGLAFAAGLADAGIIACGKHFPGHGDTAQDSHFALPRVEHARERLDAVELGPFRAAAAAGVPMLMTAHVVYEALDPIAPATLSERISFGVLRRKLGFAGLLVSDDLEMRALADHHSVAASAVAAVRAGSQLLLVCSDVDRLIEAHAALRAECERSPEFRSLCERAAARSLALKRRFPPRPSASLPELPSPELLAVLAEIDAS